jgi:hypothetical protein
VPEVIAVEPEPALRALATSAAGRAAIPLRVVGGTADRLPLEDESVDGVSPACPLLRPRPRPRARRASPHPAPAGEPRFYEHVIPHRQPKRFLLQAVEHSGLWPVAVDPTHSRNRAPNLIGAKGLPRPGVEPRYRSSTSTGTPLSTLPLTDV